MTTLTDVEKEMLGFLYGRIGHRANAGMTLRELQNHFGELSPERFWPLCEALIAKGLVHNKSADLVQFSPEGWKLAHALQGAPAIRHPRMAVETREPPKEHLVWDLSRMADYERACRFARYFRQSLCVYSAPVEQLYTNYELVVPRDNQKQLIIMPNPQAHHDTFNGLNADACIKTNLFITPGKEGDLQLLLPLNEGGWRELPLGVGLNFIQNKLGPDVPFLPVLTKGDLRELRPSQPVVHLHRLVLHKIRDRSELEIRSIRRVIQDNLAAHFGFRLPGKSIPA